MHTPVRKCPNCNASLFYKDIMSLGRFSCPSCHSRLQPSDFYVLSVLIAVLGTPALICTALGFSWQYIILVILVAFLPLTYLAGKVLKYVIPPRIELSLPPESTLNLRNGPPS